VLTVRAANRCFYCIESHAEFLRWVTLEDNLIQALCNDYHSARITERERVMLDYAVQITKDATRVTADHHDRLRAAGFEDRAILQITLITAWFNYINRVADALGIGRDHASNAESQG
jgi:uncharacterized peroxidase-related enzyme